MATKDQILEKLTALGVEADLGMKKDELEDLLAKAEKDKGEIKPPKIEKYNPKVTKDVKRRTTYPGYKWIPVDTEKVRALQNEGRLAGFDPARMEALVKDGGKE